MEFEFEAKCVLKLEHSEGMKSSRHVETKFGLEVSQNLDRPRYLTDEDLPTAAGSQVLTSVFVQGLLGNIHHAHQKGYRDSAEHLRYIISELERGFIQIAHTDTSRF